MQNSLGVMAGGFGKFSFIGKSKETLKRKLANDYH